MIKRGVEVEAEVEQAALKCRHGDTLCQLSLCLYFLAWFGQEFEAEKKL